MAVRLDDVRFRYSLERFSLEIDELSIELHEPTAIVGPSGCGKTTLLRLVAGILRPEAGRIRVLGEEVSAFGERAARAFRIRNVGLVFQEFELLDYLTARENILLPFRVSAELTLSDETEAHLDDLAARTGITHLLGSHPRNLSQGERQRVAICRALVTQPKLVLADEPTGSLDPENQQRIVDLLRATTEAAGAGLIMVTHDHELLGHFERVVELPDVIRAEARAGS